MSTMLKLALAIVVVLAATAYSAPLEDIAKLRARLHEEAAELENVVTKTLPDIHIASDLLDKGICLYKGFCPSNPGISCVDVKASIGNQTTLPDGKYWIIPTLKNRAGFNKTTPIQVECMMSEQEGGWTLLFDDSNFEDIRQQVKEPVNDIPFKELLAYTTSDLRHESNGKRTFIYFVDETHLSETRGFTFDDIMDSPWVGQDEFGQGQTDNEYPNYSRHYRFKYVGKPNYYIKSTLFVLDDGDIGPPDCRRSANAQDDSCFFKDRESSKFPQTCYGGRGVLSFGCYENPRNFTQCGSCQYDGYGYKQGATQDSVVRKLYAR